MSRDAAIWEVERRVNALSMKSLMAVYEDVEYAHRGALADWCHSTARALYDELSEALEECPDYVWWCRQHAARELAEAALVRSNKRSSNLRLSSSVANIVRVWAWLDTHEDPVKVMRLKMLSLHDSAIDALAGLARSE